MTVEYLAYQLIAGYGKNPNVTSFVDDYDFYLLPIVNPDGFVYARTARPLSPAPTNRSPAGESISTATGRTSGWGPDLPTTLALRLTAVRARGRSRR
jgi:murein tripeptide amidase MpaA